MKTRFVHIGYPKNLSSTLQADFFNKHPDLLFLGIKGGTSIDYIDDEVELAMETYLLYAKDFKYEEKKQKIRQVFENWFKKAEKKRGVKAVGLSLELLCFSFSSDHIDVTTKAKRLREIFGNKTKIIMIIRQQWDLLRSLYRECVKIGYAQTFMAFIDYAYKYQDRNFLYDFCYDKTYDLYVDLFGKENMLVLPIESVRDRKGKLIEANGKLEIVSKLSDFLGVDYYSGGLGHYNAPLSKKGLVQKRRLNAITPHDLGNQIMGEGVNTHRQRRYFINDLGLKLSEKQIFRDVLIKRRLIRKAERMANGVSSSVSYKCEKAVKAKVLGLYGKSNRRLNKSLKGQLPTQYFELEK